MTIQNVKNELSGLLHGGSTNKVKNFYDLCRRTGANVLAEISPREVRRIKNLTNAIHDDIYNYAAPSDLGKIIDIRPQINRNTSDNFSQWFSEEFDQYKDRLDDLFSVRHSDGVKSLRISKDISPAPITLNSMNSLTDNGTVAIVGAASGLEIDSQIYVTGSNSIKFDLAADGDGIQITDMSEVDLSDHDEDSEHFIRVYLPTITGLTSITPIWGNDLDTNYWTGTAQTEQADGTAFRVGWNVIKTGWATETGTVDPSAIDNLKLTFQITQAISNVRVDFWTSSIGEIFEIEYYSKYLFRNSSGNWIETPTSDSDIVNLDSDSYNIFIFEALKACAQQIQGVDSGFDVQYANSELEKLYKKYKESYPNEDIKPQSFYYKRS